MTATVITLGDHAKQLREQGRVASLRGDKSAANRLYRTADRFDRAAFGAPVEPQPVPAFLVPQSDGAA